MQGDLPKLIAQRMPQLADLSCVVDTATLTPDTTMRFPPSLLTLNVQLAGSSDDYSSMQLGVLFRLIQGASRLTKLCIRNAPPPSQLKPSHLALLMTLRDTLTDIEILGPPRSSSWPGTAEEMDQWTADHMAVFRALPNLAHLRIASEMWYDAELELLTADPVPPKLGLIDIEQTYLSARACAAIGRLTSLTWLVLEGGMIDPAFIGQLVNLETVRIDMRGREVPRTDAVMRALAHCTRITSLDLIPSTIPSTLTDADLALLLPGLKQLRTLHLHIPTIDNLSCLASATNLADTLESLTIFSYHAGLPSHALVHLRALRRLKSARLRFTANAADARDDSIACTPAHTPGDEGSVFLSSLELLDLGIAGSELDLSVLGRLPQLRSAQLMCEADINLTSLVSMLAQCAQLDRVSLTHPALTNAHLVDLVRSLSSLRSLEATSETAHFDGLSFASSSTQLASSLEELVISATSATVESVDLHHLHSLTGLRRLRVQMLAGSLSDADRAELDTDSSTFRRDIWPHMTRAAFDAAMPSFSSFAQAPLPLELPF